MTGIELFLELVRSLLWRCVLQHILWFWRDDSRPDCVHGSSEFVPCMACLGFYTVTMHNFGRVRQKPCLGNRTRLAESRVSQTIFRKMSLLIIGSAFRVLATGGQFCFGGGRWRRELLSLSAILHPNFADYSLNPTFLKVFVSLSFGAFITLRAV